MTAFDFLRHFFGNNDHFTSSNKAKRRRSRTLRIEELESRELLDAGLMSALDDAFYVPREPETASAFIEIESTAGNAASRSSSSVPAQSSAPAAAPPADANSGDLAVYNSLLTRGCEEGDFTWQNGRVTEMRVNGRGLTGTLDVSALTALISLSCWNNQLTALDVSQNTALQGLYCYLNQLTALDVSGCTALTSLSCSRNQLTVLDVSGCTALTGLSCNNNQLTALDVSQNTALQTLQCYLNQLTALDVSGCTALTFLDCSENQLTTLDVSQNTALTQHLRCSFNQLTALDVSKNTALTFLDCSENQLTTLDVSQNTALTRLECYYNQLTALDVSQNTALIILLCESNQLTALDVSQNTALTVLMCSNNQLTALDVSQNTALTSLYCDSNQLTFSTLLLPSRTISTLSCTNQAAVLITLGSGNIVDISSEYLNGTTTYTWYYSNGTSVDASLYTAANGIFTFTGLQNGNVIYCEMTNPGYPGLTLQTTEVTIREVVDPLTTPTHFHSTGKTSNSVSLAWNSVPDATGYQVQYRTATGGQWSSVNVSVEGMTATVSLLAANTEYEFRVRAVNDGNESDWSELVPPVRTDSDSIDFQSTAHTHNSVTFTWNTLPNLIGYTLQYRKWTDPVFTTWTPAPGAHETSATITGLEPETTYEFMLTATSRSGSAVALTIETTLGIPATPTILSAIPSENSIQISWSQSANATGYELWYKARGASDWVQRNIYGISATSYTITGLASSTSYDIQVRAVDSQSSLVLVSKWAARTVTTTPPLMQPPATPVNFAVKSGSVTSTSVTLTWASQTGLTGYTLQRKLSSESTWTNVSTSIAGSATEYNVTNLDVGTKYDFRLIARNAAGDSNPAELRNIETVGLGTNYAVLFAGGAQPLANYDRYYNAIKDLYSVLNTSYGLARENIWIVYADGTNPAPDRSNGKNSDMSFALTSNVLSATYTNFDSVFMTLGNKMTADDHLLFFSYDHGGGAYSPSTTGEETLTAWGMNITDKQVAQSVERIQQGYVTMVFSQCFSGGILDNIVDPVTGQKKISTNAHLFGMAGGNHYEVTRSGVGIGFATGFINALRTNIALTSDAFVYAKTDFGDPRYSTWVAQGIYPNNGGTGNTNVQHPWGIGEVFSIFVSASGNSYDSDAVNLSGWNDSLIITHSSTSTIDSLEFVSDKPVYINFGYSNPLGADVSATVSVVGGNLTQPQTFSLGQSAITPNDSGQGQLRTNLNIGTFDAGVYTVCIELFVNGEYTILEKTFEVAAASSDIADTLLGASSIIVGAGFAQYSKIGDGQYGGKDVDFYRYDAIADDIGKTLTFSSIAAASTLPADTYLRLFSAAGVELAHSVYSFNSGLSSLFYTITAATSYYIAVSSLANTTYNPSTANSGTEGNVGYYLLSGSLADSKPDLSMFYDYCWIDNIVVSTSPAGTNSGVDLTENDTLYVNYKFTNSGYATAGNATVVNRITIAGTNGYSRSEEFPMSAALAAGGFQTLPESFNWGKLEAGTYTITVTLNATGVLSELPTENNTASWEFTVAVTSVLDTPTVSATKTNQQSLNGTEGTVKAVWNLVAGANGYTVQLQKYDEVSGDYVNERSGVTLGAAIQEYTFTNVAPGEYRVCVTAADSTGVMGNSSPGDSQRVEVEAYRILDAPGNVTVTKKDETTITVAWNPVTHASGYTIQYVVSSTDTPDWSNAQTQIAGITFADITVSKGTWYVRVMTNGTSEYSDSEYSAPASITMGEEIVTPPSAPTVSVDTNKTTVDSVTLTWQIVDGATDYEVQWQRADGMWQDWTDTTVTITGTTAAITISGFAADTTYQFRVRSLGAATDAHSGYSDVVSETTKEEETIILKPIITNIAGTGYAAIKGAKVNTSAAAVNSVTLNWIPDAKHEETSQFLMEVWIPKQGNIPTQLIATVTMTMAEDGLPSWEVVGLNKDNVTVIPSNITPKSSNLGVMYTIKISGLQSGAKYTIQMQASKDSQLSKMVKVNASTVKYAAVKKVGKVDKPSPGTVMFAWTDAAAKGTPQGSDVTYEVGIYNNVKNTAGYKTCLFISDISAMENGAEKTAFLEIYARLIGDSLGGSIVGGISGLGKTGTERSVTLNGLASQTYTFGVRATLTGTGTNGIPDGDTVVSAVAKISASPLKYRAPQFSQLPNDGNAVMFELKRVSQDRPFTAAQMYGYDVGVYDASTKQYIFGTGIFLTEIKDWQSWLLSTTQTRLTSGQKIAVREVVLTEDIEVAALSAIQKITLR